ncbi:MAG: hypothetical protein ABH804_02865 [archaeon]
MEKFIYEKITKKKEFSDLPRKDVELAWKNFEKRQVGEEEKIRLTRDLLRKVFSVFASRKLFSLKNQEPEWILKKHISTKERMINLNSYRELYSRILKNFENKKITIFDLGAGVNGFSYNFLKEVNKNIDYIAIESIGQLVDLMNYYFKTRGIESAHALHMSLFELEKLKKYLRQTKEKKILFLFKILDSLEMLEKDYSKKLLLEIAPLADKIVLSFATRSLIRKSRFRVSRNWIICFIRENFKITDEFELSGEKYILFENK